MSDVQDILWDILTSFDMHGAVATECATYITSEASGLAIGLADDSPQPVASGDLPSLDPK